MPSFWSSGGPGPIVLLLGNLLGLWLDQVCRPELEQTQITRRATSCGVPSPLLSANCHSNPLDGAPSAFYKWNGGSQRWTLTLSFSRDLTEAFKIVDIGRRDKWQRIEFCLWYVPPKNPFFLVPSMETSVETKYGSFFINKGNANYRNSWCVKLILIYTLNRRKRSTFFFFNRKTQRIINFNQKKKKIHFGRTFPTILFYDMASITSVYIFWLFCLKENLLLSLIFGSFNYQWHAILT